MNGKCHTILTLIKRKMQVPVLISHRADFSIRKCICNSEGHYKVVNGSVFQGDITVIDEHVSNNRASKCMS